ncbi:tripeptidyl-peptidase-like protein [Lineolata rhizophorae]|uniref:tripeptidyl-peptidase II n=1 Tax=Lineolata rhizophorae TaxID=578093 RepID=A0A6A6P3B4_9PEZI|nr:tripeptidyl-peptidase-like protein [Lineolata rhizophorae]
MKLTVVSAAALLSLAAAVQGMSTVLDSLRTVPEGWYSAGTPDPDLRLRFKIAVTQPNQALFEETLLQVSTPGHARYGQHLSRDELKALIRPRAESTTAILAWLRAAGVPETDITDRGEWIDFVAPVSCAEHLLDARFETFRHRLDPRGVDDQVRTLAYGVPEELRQHVRMVQPTTRFVQVRAQRSSVLDETVLGAFRSANVLADVDPSCNQTITPQCLRDLYNIGDFEPDPSVDMVLGVNGFLKQYARYDDLEMFAEEYLPEGVEANFTWTSVNGGTLPQDSDENAVEANLDIQYTVGLSYPIANNFYSSPGNGPLVPDLDQPTQASNQNEPWLEFFSWMVDLPDEELPVVLSTSYGEDEQSLPAEYARSVCDMIGQLGARGVSIIFSSGDTGVGSACQTNDGTNTTRFLPIFPAACPYVTSVGATRFVEPEQAIYFSSGGFSDLWERPAWQDEAVSAYLDKLGDQWDGLYNPAGRGFPDVAAQGANYHVVNRGAETLVGGTSASAPTVAAIIALLDNARAQVGLPPLGFLNPLIYAEGVAGLTDIVDGGSTGCTGRSIYSGLEAPYVPFASWNATEGWDPVTGWGTPDFGKLLEVVLEGMELPAMGGSNGSNVTVEGYRRSRIARGLA